jgi:glycosyltransferase involved in cell wall biosynthesis
MNNKPLISIVICNYNYGQYIGEAIESALSQTYPNIELIIIDDGSTDDSREVIEKYVKKNPKIKYYKQKNQGIVATRNRGLGLAKGDFLMFLDSDDTMPNDYVAKLYDEAVPKKLDVVYVDLQCFGELHNRISLDDFDLEQLKNRNFIDMAALIRKSAIKGIKFDIELEKQGLTHEDWDFFLNLAMNGAKIAKSDETVLNYRVQKKSRNNNSSPFNEQNIETAIYIIRKNAQKYHYPVDKEFEKLIRRVGERLSDVSNLLSEQDKIIKYNMSEIENLKQQVKTIKESRSYRIGRLFVAPLRKLKRKSR